MSRFASLSGVAFILLFAATSGAQSPCSCPLTNPVEQSAGGDSNPLTWKYWAVQKSAGSFHEPRIFCYARIVDNKSNNEVDDIFWKVAGYSKDFIARKSSLPSCSDFPGLLKGTPDQGPLHWGPSAFQVYDTAVWLPVSGWVPRKSSTEEASLGFSFEPLTSEFAFDSRMPNGELEESRVLINSAAVYFPEKKEGQIFFDIQNEGSRPIAMLLNVPISSDDVKYLPLARDLYRFKGGEKETFRVPVRERPKVRPTTVILYGEDGSRAALETGGFYVPAVGETRFSDDELWKER